MGHRIRGNHTWREKPVAEGTTPRKPRKRRARKQQMGSSPVTFKHLGIVDLDGDSPEMAGESIELTFDTIKRSASERRTLGLTYVDRSGQRTQREVEPYKLERKHGKLILWAWCRTRDAIRMFEIDRMRGLTIGAEEYDPRFEIEIPGAEPDQRDDREEEDPVEDHVGVRDSRRPDRGDRGSQ